MSPSSMFGFLALATLGVATHVERRSSDVPPDFEKMKVAHGIMMGLSFAILFPSGAILLRAFNFRGLIWLHAGWQIVAYIIALAAFGIGVWMSVITDQLVTSNGHSIIGIIVMGVLILQVPTGILAHKLWKTRLSKTTIHYVHRWIGRVFLVFGAINGGLGLQLAAKWRSTVAGEIAYGVLAGFFYLLWAAVCMWTTYQAPKDAESIDSREKSIAQQGQQIERKSAFDD